jgi:hypothetical protein
LNLLAQSLIFYQHALSFLDDSFSPKHSAALVSFILCEVPKWSAHQACPERKTTAGQAGIQHHACYTPSTLTKQYRPIVDSAKENP